MRLTAEEHPETIKRFQHIRPARGRRALPCSQRCPGTKHTCTLEKGHRGLHAAHRGLRKRTVAVWHAGAGAETSAEKRRSGDAPSPSRRGRRPRPTPSVRKRTGPIQALHSRITSVVTSFEDALFLFLFLAFVGFAIHWLLLIIG